MTAWERYDGAYCRAIDIVRDMTHLATRTTVTGDWLELKGIAEAMQDVAETMLMLRREYEASIKK